MTMEIRVYANEVQCTDGAIAAPGDGVGQRSARREVAVDLASEEAGLLEVTTGTDRSVGYLGREAAGSARRGEPEAEEATKAMPDLAASKPSRAQSGEPQSDEPRLGLLSKQFSELRSIAAV